MNIAYDNGIISEMPPLYGEVFYAVHLKDAEGNTVYKGMLEELFGILLIANPKVKLIQWEGNNL